MDYNNSNQNGYGGQYGSPSPYTNPYGGGIMLNDYMVRGTPYEPVSSWGWVGYIILLLLPCIGFILQIVWACGGTTKKSLITFCRGIFLIELLIILPIIALLFGLSFLSLDFLRYMI